MSREELKQSGLLEQYVLGLLGPEQSADIDRMIAADPELEAEVDRLRADVNAYADARQITPPPTGRRVRSAAEFQDLDHEMILAMVERNHNLNIWRYATLAACFLLVGLCGYLFRLKEQYRSNLITERALHAQDDQSHEHDIQRTREALRQASIHWDELRTVNYDIEAGEVRVHLFAENGMALLDLSDLSPPAEGHAYYLFHGPTTEGDAEFRVARSQLTTLFPLELKEGEEELHIYHWQVAAAPPFDTSAADHIATVRILP